MTSTLRLRFLGPFQVERAGEPLTAFKSNKVRALLAYLAVERQTAHHREVLASLLWPESDGATALALLRDVLSNLRALLGDRDAATPYIRVTEDTLRFIPRADTQLDVATFAARSGPGADPAALEEALSLYRGDFLEGFALRDTPDFEAWLLLQREAHRRTARRALYRLATHYLQTGANALAQAAARRQLSLEPYAEEAHRQLLRALALDGQRSRALAHYADYRDRLREELDAEPDLRTTALAQRIRDHQLQPHATGDDARTPRESAVRPAPAVGLDVAVTVSGGAVRGSWGDRPFVARESELRRLEAARRQAQQGRGQIVLIAGEAGSGKTRLIEGFIRHTTGAGMSGRRGAKTPEVDASAKDAPVGDAPIAAWGTCNAQVGGGDPFLPFREILRLLGGDLNTSALKACLTPVLAQALEREAPAVRVQIAELGPDLIGTLLPHRGHRRQRPARPSGAPPLPAAICDQVTRVLDGIARHVPLILVIEDLHWADQSTLNLLAHLGRRLRDSRILLIGSYRPAAASPALTQTLRELQRREGDIVLDLDRAAGRDFVDAYLDTLPNALDAPFREGLTRQTAGHPLFTVALVAQLQADGGLIRNAAGQWVVGPHLAWDRVPPQVEAVIGARLARLPEDLQALLTVASVEGEVFTAEVVADVLHRPGDTVLRALSRTLQRSYAWVEALGLVPAGDRRIARYRFRHSLFQQYLYAQLDAVERARHHETVALALARLHGDDPDHAARLAYHFEAAGLLDEAVGHLGKAGDHAYQLAAPGEAVQLYRRGLALLEALPPSPARDRRELALLMGLELPLFGTVGWGAPERAKAMDRAYRLAQALGETDQLLPILRALADIATARSDHNRALAYAQRALALARTHDDRTYEALGHRMTGTAHFFLGHYTEARAHLEAGIACLDALITTAADPATLPDAGETVFLWGWMPHILLAQGYPEQAAACSRSALACVAAGTHVHAQAKMLTSAGVTFDASARRPAAAVRHAQELLDLAAQYNLPAFRGWGRFYRGWGRAAQGAYEEGLAEMLAGREALRATGTEASLAHIWALLAETYARHGDLAESAETLAEALRLAEGGGARSYLAEMRRLEGDLAAMRGDPVEAAARYEAAIALAQEQGARLWELRATVALARLARDQGRPAPARERLAALYADFTEGFASPDLVAARALLQNTP